MDTSIRPDIPIEEDDRSSPNDLQGLESKNIYETDFRNGGVKM